MSLARARADAFASIAEIRDVQGRAAEMQAVHAADAHRTAEVHHAESVARRDESLAGWTAAVEGGGFDPALARHWYAALATDQEAERRSAGEADTALAVLERRRATFQAAAARADAARAQAKGAGRRVDRQRDEARLAELEDRAAAVGRRA